MGKGSGSLRVVGLQELAQPGALFRGQIGTAAFNAQARQHTALPALAQPSIHIQRVCNSKLSGLSVLHVMLFYIHA